MPEYVLKSDGRTFRRPAEIIVPGETEIQVNPQTIAAMMPKNRVRLTAFMNGPRGPVNVSMTESDIVFATRLKQLDLECTIAIDEKGEVTPTWQDDGTFIKLVWPVPSTMGLIYCARAIIYDVGTWRIHEMETFLFALDKAKRSYRLPLPNLHDEGHICTGQGSQIGPCPAELFLAGFNRFLTSRWNSHVISSDAREKSNTLFAFKAVGNGFESVPVAEWKPYCFTSVHSILTDVVL